MSTRVCNLAGVLPSASFTFSGSALTAASAAALVLFTVSFNALMFATSSAVMMSSAFASANAFSAACSAASAAFTLSKASATALLLISTAASPTFPISLIAFAITCEPSFTLLAEIVTLPVFGSITRSELFDTQLPSLPFETIAVCSLPALST